MKRKITWRPKQGLNQAVNMFISASNMARSDSLLEPLVGVRGTAVFSTFSFPLHFAALQVPAWYQKVNTTSQRSKKHLKSCPGRTM